MAKQQHQCAERARDAIPQWRAKRAEAEAAIRLLPHHVERRQRPQQSVQRGRMRAGCCGEAHGVARAVGQQVGQA